VRDTDELMCILGVGPPVDRYTGGTDRFNDVARAWNYLIIAEIQLRDQKKTKTWETTGTRNGRKGPYLAEMLHGIEKRLRELGEAKI
jgi:hypothetical protein